MQVDHNKLTIAAAMVAAELHFAELTARQLTISAKNAAAIVLRAGSRAAGLSVISSFYDELAGKTIKLARAINTTAISLSVITVAEWRTTTALSRIRQAYSKAQDSQFRSRILPLEARITEQLTEIEARFQSLLGALNSDLQEIQKHMRAIDVVAVTSRLEAHRTGEFKEGLLQMANTIQQQTSDIKAHITRSMTLLNDAMY